MKIADGNLYGSTQPSANIFEKLDKISNIQWKCKWLKMTPEELENLK